MYHYVVINEYVIDGTRAMRVLGVTDTYAEARMCYEKYVKLERKAVAGEYWETYQDDEELYDAGASDNWGQYHTRIFIAKEMEGVQL